MSAMTILDTQIFEFTTKDLLEIKEMWENCDETQQFNSRSQYRITIELI